MQVHLILFASPVLLTDLTHFLPQTAERAPFPDTSVLCVLSHLKRRTTVLSICKATDSLQLLWGGNQKKNHRFPYSWRTKANTFPAALHACLN